MLQHFSSMCRATLSLKIMIGRTRGDKFLVFLPFVSPKATVQILEQLRADLPPAGSGEYVLTSPTPSVPG